MIPLATSTLSYGQAIVIGALLAHSMQSKLVARSAKRSRAPTDGEGLTR